MDNITNSTETAYDADIPLMYPISYCVVFPAICMIGLFGNFLTLIVVCKESRSSSITWLILSLSVSDISVLASRLSYALLRITQIYFQEHAKEVTRYIPSCALLEFTNYFQKISKMILVQIGGERIMAVWFPLKCKFICSPSRTAVIISSLVLLVSAIEIPYIVDIFVIHTRIISQGGEVFSGISATMNEIQRHTSNIRKEHVTLFLISRYIFDFFPLFFLSISSFIVVIGIKRSASNIWKQGNKNLSNQSKHSNQSKQITKMLVSICIIFVVLCLPTDFFSVALYSFDVTIPSAYYILFDAMTTTNNAINFIFYCAFNKTYRQQYKRLVLCKRS